MKSSKSLRFTKPLLAALAGCCAALIPSARAVDYVWNVPLGYWDNPASWLGGVVPVDTGVWDLTTITNGTAILTNAAAAFEETQVGNSGLAGNLVVTNGGVLPVNNWLVIGRTGNGGNTPMSRLTVAGNGVVNKTGDGFIVGDGTFCVGEVIVKDSAQVNITGGWNGIGNGNGGVGYLTLQDNAVYNVGGGRDWNIGDFGTGRGFATIKDNATLTVANFWIGKGEQSFGVVKQTGGAIVGIGGNEWCIGGTDSGAAAVQGYYDLSGGTFTSPNNLHIGRWGKGLLYQSGGSLSVNGWTAVGRELTGTGILYITGGLFHHTDTGMAMMVAEQPSRGEVTVAGTGTLRTTGRLVIGNGGNGVVNLNNGGTVRVPQIVRWNGSGYLNFNGGTVLVDATQPAFMNGLTEAVVYSGSAIFDTAGNDITIEQALVPPSGNGVQSISIADGGSGYLAPPVVQIDPSGVGFGATAVAQINPTTGVLTNILVTSSGYGYSAAPNVTLVGGAAATPATPNTAVLAPATSGGLIKNGLGTLTLAGGNTYTGPTAVNAGKLVVTANSTLGGGAYAVANAAGLGVNLVYAGAQVNQSSLTLNNSTVDLDLGGFGNPTVAPLNVATTLGVNGVVTINIADSLPQLGQFPLIDYSSRAGSGSFILGTLPLGVSAVIVTNVVNSTIDLNITAVAAPRWEGNVSGVWDINTTPNWVELSTSLPATYHEGNSVLFNDQATGTNAVSLGVTVNPAKVTVNNTNLNYSITGNGRIAGAAGLLKQGAGVLNLNTTNDYTGVTRIEGGKVAVTNLANGGVASSIGRASAAANNLVLAGGSLSYTGLAITIDRGYSVQGPNGGIETLADLTLTGPVTSTSLSSFVKGGAAKLTYLGAGVRELSGGGVGGAGYRAEAGTLVFDGSGGGQTNHIQNEFWVGNTIDQGAALILTNTILNVDSWVAVGRGNGSAGYSTTATLYNSRLRSGSFSAGYANSIAGHLASQSITLNNGSSITNNGDMNLGESAGSTTTIQLNDTSVMYSAGRVHLGWNTGVGTMTLANSSILNANAWFSIGHQGGNGTLTVKDNATLRVALDMNVTDVDTGTGTMNIQNNAAVVTGSLFVGKGTSSVGILNQTGGSVLCTGVREAHVGFRGQGTYNLSAGSLVAPSHWFVVGRYATGPGEFNVTGGTFIHGTNDAGRLLRVGEEGTGVLNVSGTGSIISAGNAVTLGNTGAGNGTINLNGGGSLQARQILGGPGIGGLNFNGGVLRVGANPSADFIPATLTSANVLAGGAIIDTGTNKVGVGSALLDGSGGGGLTKQGTGALYLNGANTYTGSTLVSAGTLGGIGVILGPVSVAAGATLAPGTSVGTLTINNTLSLAGTSTTVIEVDKNSMTSDLVAGVTTLTYGGTLVLKNLGGVLALGDTFNVFDATTFSGSFSSVVSQTPGQTVTWDTSKLNVDGTVKVATAVANPVTLTSVVSGGNLNLSWPASQLGYRLEVQTNPITVGLSNNWVTVTGSADVTSVSVPVSTATPTAFYRLVFP